MRPPAALALLFLALPAAALDVHGRTFADSVTVGGSELPVRGGAFLRWKLFWSVESAACYAPKDADDLLADVPKRLEFSYFRDFSAADLSAATNATIGINADAETVARIRPQLDALNALYPAVKDADHLALTYQPGTGTVVSHNGKDLGTVPGAEFARCLFAIWFGDKPVDADFKLGLLGGK